MCLSKVNWQPILLALRPSSLLSAFPHLPYPKCSSDFSPRSLILASRSSHWSANGLTATTATIRTQSHQPFSLTKDFSQLCAILLLPAFPRDDKEPEISPFQSAAFSLIGSWLVLVMFFANIACLSPACLSREQELAWVWITVTRGQAWPSATAGWRHNRSRRVLLIEYYLLSTTH